MKLINLNNIKFTFFLLLSLILVELNRPSFYRAEQISESKLEKYINQSPKDNFYILGPGDILKLEASEHTKILDKIFVIDGEGTINLKRLNKVFVQGLTINELTNVLNEKYKKYIFEPNVQLTMVKYRPVKVYIAGQVENPGHYVFRGDFLEFINDQDKLTKEFAKKINFDNNSVKEQDLSNDSNLLSLIKNNQFPSLFYAIRKSGGLKFDADLTNIVVKRKNSISRGSGEIQTTLNLLDTLNLDDLSQNIRLVDGDSIFVPKAKNIVLSQISKATLSNLNPKFIDIFISGRVNNPGKISVNKGAVLTEAIDIAGGLKVIKGNLVFIRYKNDGSIDRRTFRFDKRAKRGSHKNPFLKNGDIVYLEKGLLNSTNEVVRDITSPLEGLFSTYGFYKLVTGN